MKRHLNEDYSCSIQSFFNNKSEDSGFKSERHRPKTVLKIDKRPSFSSRNKNANATDMIQSVIVKGNLNFESFSEKSIKS